MADTSQSEFGPAEISAIRDKLSGLPDDLICKDPTFIKIGTLVVTVGELLTTRRYVSRLPVPNAGASCLDINDFLNARDKFRKDLLALISQIQELTVLCQQVKLDISSTSLQQAFDSRNELIGFLERIDRWWPEDLVARLTVPSPPK